jgi:hypothetical protein
MVDYCFICSKEYTLSFFAEGKYFTKVDDKSYCVNCFEDLENSVIYCERCYKYEHRNNKFDENFVKSLDPNSNVIYYHIKCLFESEKCPICKDYLKNKEYVDVFIDYGCKIKYHTSCVQDKNNVFNFDICEKCGISLRVKCETCNHRFMDCYNDNCDTYGYDDTYDRYDGNCSDCNW